MGLPGVIDPTIYRTMSGRSTTELLLAPPRYIMAKIKLTKYCFFFQSEMWLRSKSIRSWCDGSSDLSFMVDPMSYFSFQPVLRDWCNKSRGMCYPVCGMVHIKEFLMLIGKSSPCGGRGFLSHYLSGPLPYVRRHITVNNVLSASLNKINIYLISFFQDELLSVL